MSLVEVVSNGSILPPEETLHFLRDRRLYKTLSLAIASQSKVAIPATILISDESQVSFAILQHWQKLPLMMRMDYSILPSSKPIGGIPIYSFDALRGISSGLFSKGLLPLFHPHASRFEDRYSVGVMLSRDAKLATIEIVGAGFDAGDLRLGWGMPHESMCVDLVDLKIKSRSKISESDYALERRRRLIRIEQLQMYTDIANSSFTLSSNLPEMRSSNYDFSYSEFVPSQFSPMSRGPTRELIDMVLFTSLNILPLLPHSPEYVASFSFIPNSGWILWDVYGHWYKR